MQFVFTVLANILRSIDSAVGPVETTGEVGNRQHDCPVRQAEQLAQPDHVFRADFADSHVLGPCNPQRQCLILRVAGGGDKIIAGRKAQSAFRVLHGEVFKVCIRISRKNAGHYPAKQRIALCPQTYVAVLNDEIGHVLVAGLVLVLRAVTEQLVKFLEVNSLAVFSPVEPFDEQRPLRNALERCQGHLRNGVFLKKGRARLRSDILKSQNVGQCGGRELSYMGCPLTAPYGTEHAAFLYCAQFWLNPGKRRSC